jgi:hypothetical protein
MASGKATMKGKDIQNPYDGECKDPLERKGYSQELPNPKCCEQDGQGESNHPVLEGEETEGSIDEPSPHEDVCHNSGGDMVSIDNNSASPIQRREGPGERSGEHGLVLPAGSFGLSDVSNQTA